MRGEGRGGRGKGERGEGERREGTGGCGAKCTRAAALSALAPATMPSTLRCRSASSLYSVRETVSTVSTWGVGEAERWRGGECEGKAEAEAGAM